MATYQAWSESYFTNLTPDQHNANNKTEAKRIASDFEHCQHYEEVEYCDGFEYKVGKLLESTDEKANKSIRSRED